MAMDDRGQHPQSTGHLSRRGFLASGTAAFAALALAPGCVLDDIIGQQPYEVVSVLYAHEVNGFLVFETTVPSGELFAGDLTGGFVQWATVQNYSIEEDDDGFVRAPTFP